MTLTWRDGITTLAAAAAVLIERAHNLNWNWAVISNVRWAFAALVVLGAIAMLYEAVSGRFTTWLEYALGFAGAVLAVVGFSLASPAYLAWLMLDIVAIWFVSLATHVSAWIAEPQHQH
jgi:hypothetical protein